MMIRLEGVKNLVEGPRDVEFPRKCFVKHHRLRKGAVDTNHKQRAQQSLRDVSKVSQSVDYYEAGEQLLRRNRRSAEIRCLYAFFQPDLFLQFCRLGTRLVHK